MDLINPFEYGEATFKDERIWVNYRDTKITVYCGAGMCGKKCIFNDVERDNYPGLNANAV